MYHSDHYTSALFGSDPSQSVFAPPQDSRTSVRQMERWFGL
jgi:hypothetical protein